MKIIKSTIAIAACLTLAGLAANLNASEWNKKTRVTFSGPVRIPGKVLSAGTYVFKLVDSPSNRNIVQITNDDENQVEATVLALNDYRPEPTGKTIITFGETAGGAPSAVKAWFYPGDTFGQRFVYSTKEANELASTYHQPVPHMDNPTEWNDKSEVQVKTGESDVAYSEAKPKMQESDTKDTSGYEAEPAQSETNQTAQSEKAQTPTPEPSAPSPTEIAQNRAPQTQPEATAVPSQSDVSNTPAPNTQARRATMPTTASATPLIGLIGMMLIGLAIVSRYAIRRAQ